MSDQETASRPSEQDAPRARSRSPLRKTKKSGGGGGGFKWKSKPTNDDADDNDDRRGFSRRDGPGSRYDSGPSRGSRSNNYHNDYRRDNRDRDYRDRDNRGDRDSRRYRSRSRSPRRDRDRRGGYNNSSDQRGGDNRRDRSRDRDRERAPKKEKKEKASSSSAAAAPAAPAVAADGEEMIIVHVNDRLGTKAAIPCFASDNVGAFKVMVAARIGREPHEILLKRQGERPFKDHITLGDYGVSNGVQLDLEVDTGD